MISKFKYYIYAIIAALIAWGSGHFFLKARAGVHFENMSLFIICIISIITVFIFLSKAKADSCKLLAKELGLKVSGSLSMGAGSHVDMEGELQGRTVFLRYESSTNRRSFQGVRHHDYYKFAIQINNPYKIDLYTCPQGILSTPANILSLPKKLDTSAWEWAEFITVYGAPVEAVNSIFSNTDNSEILSPFFSKVNVRIKDDKMEFEINEETLDDIIPDLKEILNYALSVANAFDNG